MELEPLADRIVVKALEQEKLTRSGIILPESAKEKPQEGKVVAVGPGKLADNGNRIASDISVGDTVIFAKFGGTEIIIAGENLIILREADILAKKTNQ